MEAAGTRVAALPSSDCFAHADATLLVRCGSSMCKACRSCTRSQQEQRAPVIYLHFVLGPWSSMPA